MNPNQRIVKGIKDTIALLQQEENLSDEKKLLAIYTIGEFLKYTRYIVKYEATTTQ